MIKETERRIGRRGRSTLFRVLQEPSVDYYQIYISPIGSAFFTKKEIENAFKRQENWMKKHNIKSD